MFFEGDVAVSLVGCHTQYMVGKLSSTLLRPSMTRDTQQVAFPVPVMFSGMRRIFSLKLKFGLHDINRVHDSYTADCCRSRTNEVLHLGSSLICEASETPEKRIDWPPYATCTGAGSRGCVLSDHAFDDNLHTTE
jgi:hypothetical protein